MDRLEHIPLELTFDEVGTQLRAKDHALIQRLLDTAQPLISAKAAYRVCYVAEKLEDCVVIDGVRFYSRVLRKNLDHVGRVFPYVVTIGTALEQRADASADMLEKYYLDAMANMALRKARNYLQDHLCSRFAVTGLSYMSPGSLADWPIGEQRPLFSLLKDAESSIGVRLTESLLMIPRKSVSGLYFPTEVSFYSCQLCPRQQCEGRKAPYSKDLADSYGILK